MIYTIILRPEPERPGCYVPMRDDGTALSRATRTPLVLAARALLRDHGAIAGDLIRARHADSEIVAMSALVGTRLAYGTQIEAGTGLPHGRCPKARSWRGGWKVSSTARPARPKPAPESTGRKAA